MIIDSAATALAKLEDQTSSASLSRTEEFGLEAVVDASGLRPPLLLKNGFVDLDQPSAKNFSKRLSMLRPGIESVCMATGRINDAHKTGVPYWGTGWLVAEDLVITNAHVCKELISGASRGEGNPETAVRPGISFNLGHEAGQKKPLVDYPVVGVAFLGPEGQSKYEGAVMRDVNLDSLDLAVLRIDPSVGRSELPPPILAANPEAADSVGFLGTQGRWVYTLGYPGVAASTTPDVFKRLFNGRSGFKTLSPGTITVGVGMSQHDQQGWLFTHDASTLGGSSGSPVVDLEADGSTALGLHFAGQPGTANWAHSFEVAGVLEGPFRS